MFSAIVPTLDEAAAIGPLVTRLREEVDEVVVVDGGSADATRRLARDSGAVVVEARGGRGPQLDAGAAAARGDLLWFLHADSRVPFGLGAAVRAAAGRARWGCCAVAIEADRPLLRWTSAVMNRRARWTGACSGDMGIWATRTFFDQIGGFGGLPAFEDLDFSDRARAKAAWVVVEPALGTSARRWESEGGRRTAARLLALRVAYRLGVDPARLAARYTSRPR